MTEWVTYGSVGAWLEAAAPTRKRREESVRFGISDSTWQRVESSYYACTGVLSRSACGYLKQTSRERVTNRSINISIGTNKGAVSCTVTCVARSNVASFMGPTIEEES